MSLLTSSVRSILRCSSKPNAGTSYAVRTLSTTSSAPTWTCRARTPSASLSLATNASRVYSRRTSSSPLVHRRRMGNPAAPQGALSDIPMDTYHQVSDHTMGQLYEELEALIDEQGEPGYEVEYHSGVLTLNLGPRGTYVINKQPPNKQIWLSSPVSGPKRYDLTPNGEWTYLRDGITLDTQLNTELNQVFMQRVEFDLRIPKERLGVWNGSGSGES